MQDSLEGKSNGKEKERESEKQSAKEEKDQGGDDEDVNASEGEESDE